VSSRSDLGVITLARPRAINALNLAMIEILDRQLAAWAEDPSIAMVLIDGEGERGLCAGGDIKSMYASARADGSHARELWRVEYRMNTLIADYPKPICALMHGIVLGGGVGVSAHASLRVVTSNASVGMPEVTIGMVPDVGATWLLSHAPGELGTHLALTGISIGAADAIACGLADVHVPDSALDSLRAAPDAQSLQRAVAAAATPPAPGVLDGQREWIDACYSADSVLEILARLDTAGAPEASAAAELIRTKSPTALVVTLRALRQARELPSLHEAIEIEFRIASRRLTHPDFAEGIRAQVVDKDRNPQWHPAALADVSEAEVDAHFA
jgi:enoyl-CoA hydratase